MHCLLTELLFLVKFPNWWLSILNSTQLWSSPSIGRTSLGELQLDDYQLLLHLGQTSTGLQSIVIEFQPVKIIWGGVQKNEILPFQLNFMISTEFHHFNSISQFQLNFTISTEFHHFNWISPFQLTTWLTRVQQQKAAKALKIGIPRNETCQHCFPSKRTKLEGGGGVSRVVC